MHEVYLIPQWFFIFSIVIELLFSLVTLAVAVTGLKVYRISKDKALLRFSLAFLMISISYAAWAVINTSLASKLREGILTLSLIDPPAMHILGVYIYIVFFIAGLVTLAFTTFKIEKSGAYYLLLGLALVAVVSSVSKFITFRIVSLFLITFIAYHYLIEWQSNNNKKTFATFLAFLLLIASNIFFMFIKTNASTFILGHLLELGAYSLLLFTLLKTLKRK